MSMSDKVFGSYTTSNKKRIMNIVNKTNSYEEKFANITHSNDLVRVKVSYLDKKTNKKYYVVKEMTREELEFFKKTNEFRKRLRNGETPNDIMSEAFALAREATRRKLGMFHYDVQVEAAAAMQDNNISEMKTGEGKSLVQILSAYLNALEATKSIDPSEWKSVHVMTSNDYLAQRDQNDNKSVYSLLGLTSGYAMSQDKTRGNKKMQDKKRQAYDCDIVYGTTKTIAFDYLEDNHVMSNDKKYMRKKPSRAIVDEADDILLDQATRPLILSKSQQKNEDIDLYEWAVRFINGERGYRNKEVTCHIFNHFDRDKSTPFTEDCALYMDDGFVYLSDKLQNEIYGKNGKVTEDGILKEKVIIQCLLAKYYYKESVQYQLIEDKKESEKANKTVMRVVLTDEFTGRLMDKTKYQNGIQEAIEVTNNYYLSKQNNPNKELKYSTQNNIIAKCTYPDFFTIYENGVCGMTGTSDIEEFSDIYGMQTYEVPSRKKNIRIDEEDEVYLTLDAKYKAIVKEILACQKTLQPVLIGTTNVSESDELCSYLKKYKIRYQRLDAVNASNEDDIKKTAGLLGSVTVATNMAGRGIDIKLGKGVKEVGGLYVISTSKNRNRRIDNQLKGRASRQGEPGKTKCFMSLDDNLVKTRYGTFRLEFYKQMHEGEESKITNDKIIKIVKNCQLIEEDYSKQARKQSELRDAKVFTKHKKIIYDLRQRVLDASIKDMMIMMKNITKTYVSSLFESNPSYKMIQAKLGHLIKVSACYSEDKKEFEKNVFNAICKRLKYAPGSDFGKYITTIRTKMLKVIDDYWVSHMDYLNDLWKNCVYYSYSSMDPMELYERESYKLLESMTSYVQNEMITYACIPSMSYGNYVVKEPEVEEENEERLERT